MATAEKNLIEVEPRDERGKNASRRLRKAGKVPASVYGMNLDPFSVAVVYRHIDEVLHLGSGQNTVLTLTMAGADKKREVMIRDLQRDPVSGRVTHVDFVRVDATSAVTVSVPIQVTGLAEGVKNEGGILDHVHREVQVSCLPGAIPEHVDVDVTDLHLNQHVSVSDIAAIEGVTFLDEPSMIIAVVSATKVEEAETTTDEDEEVDATEGETKEGEAKQEAAE